MEGVMKRVLVAAITIIVVLAHVALAAATPQEPSSKSEARTTASPARGKRALLTKERIHEQIASLKWPEPHVDPVVSRRQTEAFQRNAAALAEALVRHQNAELVRSAGKDVPVALLADELRLREADVRRLQSKALPQSLAAYEERDLFRMTKGRMTQAIEQNVDAYAAGARSAEERAAAQEALVLLRGELTPKKWALLTRTAEAHAATSGAERVMLHRARKSARSILGAAAGAVLTMLSFREALAEEQVVAREAPRRPSSFCRGSHPRRTRTPGRQALGPKRRPSAWCARRSPSRRRLGSWSSPLRLSWCWWWPLGWPRGRGRGSRGRGSLREPRASGTRDLARGAVERTRRAPAIRGVAHDAMHLGHLDAGEYPGSADSP